MKLLYSKILLFALALNILLTSYYAHNKNKPSITSHHTQTNRSLCECDTQSSNYDKDTGMKSVMQQFDDRTSQRFEEYQERMKEKRQKRKEQRDKNVQEIIEKDKMEGSFAEKIEKGCLRCGCGLGVVAAGVGIIGPIAVKGLENAALLVAAQKGVEAGIAKAIKGLGEIYGLSALSHSYWAVKINGTNFFEPNRLVTIVNEVYLMCEDIQAAKETHFCSAMGSLSEQSTVLPVKTISPMAAGAAGEAGKAAKIAEAAQIDLVNAASYNSYIAIAYSVISILIILLFMIIIYLILRYRRKKKMNKKLQYTKLLNQ
ncbi:surface antigen [Plasmodium falciparum UGT5.1]|uniref:Surface antigen n=1 Tax=Plasmodium falciparum UGT5.1 TaxID=1237627 RepID=W7JKV6_PLAFA|nr:surface antigen [Plasmodium falciparum UGT5.1]